MKKSLIKHLFIIALSFSSIESTTKSKSTVIVYQIALLYKRLYIGSIRNIFNQYLYLYGAKMKAFLVLLFAIFCWTTALSEEVTNDESIDEGIDENFSFNLEPFALNGTYFREKRSDKVLDCFGIGQGAAKFVNSLFEKKPTGSKALKVKFHLSTRDIPEKILYMVDGTINFTIHFNNIDGVSI